MHLAQLNITTPGRFSNYTTLPTDVVSNFLQFAIIIAGLIFFLKLLSSGFAYLTSSGDPAKIQTATKGLINALIGLIVVVSAYFIAQIIQYVFGLNIL